MPIWSTFGALFLVAASSLGAVHVACAQATAHTGESVPTPAKMPQAVIADPAPDAKFPARMEVIHVPTGGIAVNGIALVPSGPGPHPTFVLFHGLPGNEKNLDLAQAVRRAGWVVVTINYRGSWGSPGSYRFEQNLEDARATLAFIRDAATAEKLGVDTQRIVVGGHSMGGWVTLHIAAADTGLLGAVTISAGDLGALGLSAQHDRAAAVARMKDNMESLADVTPETMTDELVAHANEWSFDSLAPKLTGTRLLVLYSADFVQADSENLIAKVASAGGKRLDSAYVATDHSWSDRRLQLQALVIDWLESLRAR